MPKILASLYLAATFVCLPLTLKGSATIVIVNADPPGIGFNDLTPVAPVGGNTGTTIGQQRLQAFQAAASKWGASIDSAVTIRVRAVWTALTCTTNSAVLGSAGPAQAWRDFAKAPVGNHWYSKALANALTGIEMDSNSADINANFNVNLGNTNCLTGHPFYLGLDNNHGNNIDLVTVLTHEFAHGLGFLTFSDGQTGKLFNGSPTITDDFLLDLAVNKTWTIMSDCERAASAIDTGRLVWTGGNVSAAIPQVLARLGAAFQGTDGTGRALMFAPKTYSSGSSVSHWDTIMFPNQLMEPAASQDLTHEVAPPLDLTLSLLKDIGWNGGSAVTPQPRLSITKKHDGNFTQGQIGATYIITVNNAGAGPTTSGVTVTDILPAGLTATSISGPGWTCTAPAGPCSRSDLLIAGAGYSPITLTVNVAANAPLSVVNTATVTGGGSNAATIGDLTQIAPASSGGPGNGTPGATQSSTLAGFPGAGAASAIDGNTDGSFFHNSVTATNLDTNAWWQRDLGSPTTINTIVIWNRTDCCDTRLNDYWVYASNTPFLATDTPTTLQNRPATFSSHQTTAPSPSTAIVTGGIQGRYVRVQLNGTNYLSLAEVQVLSAPVNTGPVNLVTGKPASQSSTFPGAPGAAVAADGNTNGNFGAGSVTATNLDANPWWQADLGSAATVNSITIWNRTDCCGTRLNDYWVFVSNTPFGNNDTPATLQGRAGTFASHQTTAPGPSSTISVSAQGRYVRVQLNSAGYLSLAEVQVIGTPGSGGVSNLAQGKATVQSSTFAGSPGPGAAADGNLDGQFANGSVTATDLNANAWWQVDLGQSSAVSSVTVWNRTDCCGTRLNDYWLFISDTPFSASDTPTTLQNRAGTFAVHQTTAPDPAATIPVGAQGRYVRIQLNGTNYLSLAEVQVFGQ